MRKTKQRPAARRAAIKQSSPLDNLEYFTYHDGNRTVKADGMRILLRWKEHVTPEILASIQLLEYALESGEEKHFAEFMKVAAMFRKVLGVPDYDEIAGVGITDTKIFHIFGQFVVWMADEKKKVSGKRI